MKLSPLAIGAGAVALLLALRARASSSSAIAPTGKKTSDYYTPTDLAAGLARFVVAATKGIATSAPTGPGYVSPNLPTLTGNATADADSWIRRLESPTPGSLLGTWQAPTYQASTVSSPSVSRYSPSVDAVAAAPVYDVQDDFTLNPFALAAP